MSLTERLSITLAVFFLLVILAVTMLMPLLSLLERAATVFN